MSRNSTIVLIVWNVILSALVAWGLMRSTSHASASDPSMADSTNAELDIPLIARDTGALKDAHVAYFRMDSLRRDYELIKEKDASFATEMRKLESGLQNEQARARQRYQELMAKDPTYSTKSELEKDEAELQGLMGKLQEMQASGEERMGRMEADMLKEISKELEDYLAVFNKTAGFDYIFSIQSGGQIWVGNKDLDITKELVAGLNARHRARKGLKK